MPFYYFSPCIRFIFIIIIDFPFFLYDFLYYSMNWLQWQRKLKPNFHRKMQKPVDYFVIFGYHIRGERNSACSQRVQWYSVSDRRMQKCRKKEIKRRQLSWSRSEGVQQRAKKRRYGKYIFRWCMTLLMIGLLIFGSVCGLRLRHFYKAINGEIPAEKPDLSKFPVQGIDISRYQGDINWEVLPKKTRTICFYKATEGSTLSGWFIYTELGGSRKSWRICGGLSFFSVWVRW